MLYRALEVDRHVVAAEIAKRHITLEPQIWERYGSYGVQKCAEDAAYHLAFLAEAWIAEDARLFSSYARWAAVLLSARNIPIRHLVSNLRITQEVLSAYAVGSERTKLDQIIGPALEALEAGNESSPKSYLAGDQPIDVLSRAYLAALLKADRSSAYALIVRALDEGIDIRDIYLGVFERVQYEIGRLWQFNEIGVAQEHYCTAATQSIIARLYEYVIPRSSRNKTIVGLCVSGELHEMGLRIVCDFLEMDGWQTLYVGANTPAVDLIGMLQREAADVLAISATMSFHVQRVREMIKIVRDSGTAIKIIVGGSPFRMSPDLWKTIGADGFADNAAQLPALMARLDD